MKGFIVFLLASFFAPLCTSATFKTHLTVNDITDLGFDFKVPRLIIVDTSAPCIVYDGVGSVIENKLNSHVDFTQDECLSQHSQGLENTTKLKALLNLEGEKDTEYELYYISLDSNAMPCPPCKTIDEKISRTQFSHKTAVFQFIITG
ncbi:hypothetical protein [Alteromonas sp. C1M14]|uniref:hypothetical protein n=1 Tax=Alteromonas sp. C1M14 TaxID=2841567 RepID=UPI001C094EBE|nr:hypothetical protein [Alteromonas sp. C1M14]MBU2979868.1 hypothetical protein [Alteromonas sp. C1M14]